jgi:hypothetical protein
LQQVDPPTQPTVINPYVNAVKVSSKFDTRNPQDENYGNYQVLAEAPNGNLMTGVRIQAVANYPDKVLDNPDGWRFKTTANSSLVWVYPEEGTGDYQVNLANDALANSKLAPAVAVAGTSAEHTGWWLYSSSCCRHLS